MSNSLVPTTIYLNKDQKNQIQILSRTMNTSKAEITRLVVMKGLEAVQREKVTSSQALLSLAGLIPKDSGLPQDLSERHNEYTWDE